MYHLFLILKNLSRKEKVVLVVSFFCMTSASLFDAIEEYLEGAPLIDYFSSLLLLIFAFIIPIGFLIAKRREIHSKHNLEQKINMLEADLREQKSLAKKISIDFQNYVNGQFNIWSLTPTEKDIGLLLLKGLSFKEIGLIRKTSEQTIRNQAQGIYVKAHLDGRHDLSAYFLNEFI